MTQQTLRVLTRLQAIKLKIGTISPAEYAQRIAHFKDQAKAN